MIRIQRKSSAMLVTDSTLTPTSAMKYGLVLRDVHMSLESDISAVKGYGLT